MANEETEVMDAVSAEEMETPEISFSKGLKAVVNADDAILEYLKRCRLPLGYSFAQLMIYFVYDDVQGYGLLGKRYLCSRLNHLLKAGFIRKTYVAQSKTYYYQYVQE